MRCSFVVGALLVVLSGCHRNLPTWDARGGVFTLEVPNTLEAFSKGLAGRPVVLPGTGMLFFTGSPYDWRMWMRGMQTSIDIVWVRGGRVVKIWRSAPPCGSGDCPVVSAGVVDYVVELPPGTSERLGLVEGDLCRLAP